MRSGVLCKESGVPVTKDLVSLVRNLDLTEGDGSPWKVHDLLKRSFWLP